jgi:intergrase/recombinase
VGKGILGIAQNIQKTPTTYNGLKMVSRHRSLSMRIKYCRKIYATFLRQSGIESEIIDMLSVRIRKNIFLHHYYRPSSDYYKNRVLDALHELKKQIEK